MEGKRVTISEPPATPYNFLSLGAGVQSSALALMAATGEIGPRPTAAIFADTQAEPASVYRWLDWLESEIARSPLPFPVIRVTKGNLTADSLRVRQRVKTVGAPWSKSLIPAFVKNPDGSRGIMGRACTYDYKVMTLIKKQRELAKIKRGQKDVTVTCWIGISYDEVIRMKPSRVAWVQHRWPLVERGMRRANCLDWMQSRGYPKPPRSACVYCPFHSDAEWRRLRSEEPQEFARAVQFERDLQETKRRTPNMRGVPFLHSSLTPLDQVDFGETSRQMDFFGGECEGMCGV
jgi:hypothetical protein